MKQFASILLSLHIIGASLTANPILAEQQQAMHPSSGWHCFEKGWLNSIQNLQSTFLDDTRKHAGENIYIPAKEEGILRVITFNICMWHTIHKDPNFQEIGQLINALDPDIIILQEVVDWEKTHAYYVSCGYSPLAPMCDTKQPAHTPAIFAKNCTVTYTHGAVFKDQWNPERELSYVRLDANFQGVPLTIYGLHLEVDQIKTGYSNEDIRTKQLEELVADTALLPHRNVIIAGDFNTVREQDYHFTIDSIDGWQLVKKAYASVNIAIEPQALDYLTAQGYHTSFELLNWQNPTYTNWASRALDFIFMSPGWSLPVVGSYVYYTDLSDHLPIIADFKMP